MNFEKKKITANIH